MDKIETKILPPFKRLCVSIGVLPSSYVESLSYYECLMWLCKYLQETVVPAVNENAEAVNELINWFNTLDVQDEIDNKLDEMAESGQLADIIAQYLGLAGMITFDTVADMKNAQNLVNGSKCATLGFNSVNDGGNAIYKIRTVTNDDVVDEMFIIEMADDSLVAELIICDYLNVKQLGAVADGTTDNATIVQASVNHLLANRGGVLFFPNGKYYISSTITINNGQKPFTLLGETAGNYDTNGTQISTDTQHLFKVNGTSINVQVLNLYFINTLPKSENTFCFSTIATNDNVQTARWTFKNLGFRNFTHGINFLEYTPNNYNDGIIVENVRFSTVSRCMTFKHLEASKITNCYSEPFVEYFLYVNQSQGFSLEDCIIRGPLPQPENGCVGVILLGSSTSHTAPVVRNCLFEDVDCAFVNSMDNLHVINSRYTISSNPKINPVYLLNTGASNPFNVKFDNFIINYESDSFTTTKILFTSGSGSFTFYDLSISYTTVTNCVVSTSGYDNYTFTNLSIPNKRNWIRKSASMLFGISDQNLRVFVGNNTTITAETAPNGTTWQKGDFVLNPFVTTGAYRKSHIVGWMYVETGSNSNGFIPIQLGIDTMTTSNTASLVGHYVGQQSFNSSTKKPIWWDGTAWKYADGSSI